MRYTMTKKENMTLHSPVNTKARGEDARKSMNAGELNQETDALSLYAA